MVHLKNYVSLDEVIGTTALTPFVGIVQGNSTPIYADTVTFGSIVKFVADDDNSYFKPTIIEKFILGKSILGRDIL